MQVSKRSTDFLNSEEGIAIRNQLEEMTQNSLYNTTSTYSSKTEMYGDNLIPFVDKHMNYLTAHPNLNPALYLANLKLMTRQRGTGIVG